MEFVGFVLSRGVSVRIGVNRRLLVGVVELEEWLVLERILYIWC